MAENKKEAEALEAQAQDQATATEAKTDAEAKADTEAKAEAKKAKKADEPKTTNIYNAEYYDITIPITDDNEDDVVVIINGEATQIQRGEPVRVSAAVYEVLKNQERMDNLARKRSKALAMKKLD